MTDSPRQEWLFLCRRPPYGGSYPKAALDLLLTAAAFDQAVILAFAGDGVYQLLAGQDGGGIGLKDLSRTWPALELYEVREVVVEAQALRDRNLGEGDLVISARPVENEALRELQARARQVFVF